MKAAEREAARVEAELVEEAEGLARNPQERAQRNSRGAGGRIAKPRRNWRELEGREQGGQVRGLWHSSGLASPRNEKVISAVVGGGRGRWGECFAPASVVVLLNLFVFLMRRRLVGLRAWSQNEVRGRGTNHGSKSRREAVLLGDAELADEVNSAFTWWPAWPVTSVSRGEVSEEDYRTDLAAAFCGGETRAFLSIAAAPGLINRTSIRWRARDGDRLETTASCPGNWAGILEVMETGGL